MKSLKISLLLLLFALLAAPAQAQQEPEPFEGIVTYRTQVVSKNPKLEDVSLRILMGDTAVQYFKGPHYRVDIQGSAKAERELYRGDENVLYRYELAQDTIVKVDAGTFPHTLEQASVTGNTDKILGYEVRSYTLEQSNGTQTFFYAPALPLAKGAWTKHRYGFLDEYVKLAPYVYLGYRYETEDFIITRRAVKVQRRDIPEGWLAPPSGRPIRSAQ